MKRVTDLFLTKPRTYSFELFPPKTDQGYDKLKETIADLAKLKPDFFSCTYGAGGGSRDKTLEIVNYFQKKHQIPGVAHLTCVLHTREEIFKILETIKAKDIHNILALRGDPPKDQPDWKPGEQNFKFSSELVTFIRKNFGDYFGIGVAGFPEGHLLSPDRNQDALYLKVKMDAGANFVITQLFFDNQDYFTYVDRLRKLQVTARVIPGILPITDYNGVINFCKTCGANVPQKIHDIFEKYKENKEETLRRGIDFAIQQCKELIKGGAPGLHFYTLNKLHPVDTILQAVRK